TQLGQRLGIASQLGEGRSTQRQRESGLAERHAGTVGKLQGLDAAAAAAQQLEVLGPAGLQLRFRGQERVVRGLCIACPALARQPARARERPFASGVWKQIVRRGRPHGAQIYPRRTRWLAATHLSTFLPPWIKSDCFAS